MSAGTDMQHKNFNALRDLFGGSLEGLPDSAKSKSGGFMDLNFDLLVNDGQTLRIALAHNYVVNGDCCADPDMELRINLQTERVEAMTFQNALVYQDAGDGAEGREARLGGQLDRFLHQWLTNLKEQGHSLSPEARA